MVSSCNLEKRCAAKYPPTVRDSIVTVIKETLREVKVSVPGDSLKINGLIVLIDSLNRAQLPKTEVKSDRGKLSVEIKNSVLEATSNCDSLEAVIYVKDTEIDILKSRQETRVIETKYIPDFFKYTTYIAWGLLILVIAWKSRKFFLV